MSAKHVALDRSVGPRGGIRMPYRLRSEEHTSELQSQSNLVCRLLLEKKKTQRCLHRDQRRLSADPPWNGREVQLCWVVNAVGTDPAVLDRRRLSLSEPSEHAESGWRL